MTIVLPIARILMHIFHCGSVSYVGHHSSCAWTAFYTGSRVVLKVVMLLWLL
jgi:hypothetical protein